MTATWNATPRQVEAVLRPVLPHAGDDRHLPMLCCLNLEVADGRLLAVATNRYTLGIAWQDLAEWDEKPNKEQSHSARIYAADMQRLLAFLKPSRETSALWTLTSEHLTVVTTEGEQLTVRTVDVEFPKWRKLLADRAAKESTPLPQYGINSRWLALLDRSAKAVGEHHSMVWQFAGPLDAALVSIGERFVGVLMPARLTDVPELDLTTIGVDVPKAVAA